MNPAKKLHAFCYKFDQGSGPISLVKLQRSIKKGNCRLAVQDYFYTVHDLYLKPEQILLPQAFNNTGRFIKVSNMKPGDLIYAEKFRNKKGGIIYKPKHLYNNGGGWILNFHTAIYLGKLDDGILSFLPLEPNYPKGTPVIWHSSFISNGTAL